MQHAPPADGDTAPRLPVRRFAMRTALWMLLGGWIGSWMLFGAVVAPTAFRKLPSPEIAGSLIGPVLTALHLYGAVAGIVLALLAQGLGRRPPLRILPLAMSATCLYSHFGLSSAIAEIRDRAFGPHGNAEAAARFHALHSQSMHLFIGVGLAALALAGLHAWADTRAEQSGGTRATNAGSHRKPTKIS